MHEAWRSNRRFWHSHTYKDCDPIAVFCAHTHTNTAIQSLFVIMTAYACFCHDHFSHVKFTLLVKEQKLYILHRKNWADAGHLLLNSAAPGRSCGCHEWHPRILEDLNLISPCDEPNNYTAHIQVFLSFASGVSPPLVSCFGSERT